MRKALVVGIDYYTNVSPLHGCVNDSFAVKAMLDRHADGSVNFGMKHLTATGPNDLVCREELRQAIESLLRMTVIFHSFTSLDTVILRQPVAIFVPRTLKLGMMVFRCLR